MKNHTFFSSNRICKVLNLLFFMFILSFMTKFHLPTVKIQKKINHGIFYIKFLLYTSFLIVENRLKRKKFHHSLINHINKRLRSGNIHLIDDNGKNTDGSNFQGPVHFYKNSNNILSP